MASCRSRGRTRPRAVDRNDIELWTEERTVARAIAAFVEAGVARSPALDTRPDAREAARTLHRVAATSAVATSSTINELEAEEKGFENSTNPGTSRDDGGFRGSDSAKRPQFLRKKDASCHERSRCGDARHRRAGARGSAPRHVARGYTISRLPRQPTRRTRHGMSQASSRHQPAPKVGSFGRTICVERDIPGLRRTSAGLCIA